MSKKQEEEMSQAPNYTSEDWSAWCDRMPPGPERLHVKGTIVFPSSGYSAELVRADPQGINPDDLLLNLIISQPQEEGTTAEEKQEVSYSEEGCFKTVTILPNGIHLDVKPVS